MKKYHVPGVLGNLHKMGFGGFPGVRDSAEAAPQIHRCGKKVCVSKPRRRQRLF